MDELTTGNQNEIEEPEIQPRHHTDPRAAANIQGFWYAKEEMAQVQRQNARREAAYMKKLHERWLETEQGKLCMAFYEAFQASRKYLEGNSQAQVSPDGSSLEFEEHRLFEQGLLMMENHQEERAERDRKNLARAQNAVRAQLCGRRALPRTPNKRQEAMPHA